MDKIRCSFIGSSCTCVHAINDYYFETRNIRSRPSPTSKAVDFGHERRVVYYSNKLNGCYFPLVLIFFAVLLSAEVS